MKPVNVVIIGIITITVVALLNIRDQKTIKIEPIQVQITVDEFEFIMGRLDEMDNTIRLNGLNPAE